MSDDSLFREVDEEVRQEEFKKIWDRHGKLIVAAAATLLIGVAGYQGYNYMNVSASEKASVVYFDAIKKVQDGKLDDALATMKAVSGGGFTQLAALQQAAILVEKGEIEKAAAAYDAFAGSASNDPMLIDIAKVKAAYAMVDTAKFEELKTRLAVYETPTSIWRHHAREVLSLAAWRSGNFNAADTYTTALITDLEAPSAMQQRASILSQLLASKLPKK